jgi:hypothetical protein
MAKINERVTCGRCGGLGQWCGGACFKCNGHKAVLTRSARILRSRLADIEDRLAKIDKRWIDDGIDDAPLRVELGEQRARLLSR